MCNMATAFFSCVHAFPCYQLQEQELLSAKLRLHFESGLTSAHNHSPLQLCSRLLARVHLSLCSLFPKWFSCYSIAADGAVDANEAMLCVGMAVRIHRSFVPGAIFKA